MNKYIHIAYHYIFYFRIHCSAPFKDILDRIKGYYLEDRGITSVKGKGDMSTFWLTGQDESTPARLRSLKKRGAYYLSNRYV